MRRVVLGLVVVAVACKKEPAVAPRADAVVAQAAIAPVEAKRPPDAARASGLPAIEKTQVGALRAGAKVTRDGLAVMFPGLTVEEYEDTMEDEAIPGFAAKRGDALVVRVRTSQGKVRSVIVDDAAVPVPVGLPVGSMADGLAAAAGALACWTEFEWDGQLLCKGANADNVTFVLTRDGGYAQNTDEDAPGPVKLLVTGAKIEHVVWVPPAPAKP